MLAAIVAVSEFLLSGQPQSDCNGIFRKTKWAAEHGLAKWRTNKNSTAEIVIDDLVIAQEGNTINADGEIIHSNDFSVNESLLTGEPYAVFKSEKRVEIFLVAPWPLA
jgi:Ca2+-transporting ATPase